MPSRPPPADPTLVLLRLRRRCLPATAPFLLAEAFSSPSPCPSRRSPSPCPPCRRPCRSCRLFCPPYRRVFCSSICRFCSCRPRLPSLCCLSTWGAPALSFCRRQRRRWPRRARPPPPRQPLSFAPRLVSRTHGIPGRPAARGKSGRGSQVKTTCLLFLFLFVAKERCGVYRHTHHVVHRMQARAHSCLGIVSYVHCKPLP